MKRRARALPSAHLSQYPRLGSSFYRPPSVLVYAETVCVRNSAAGLFVPTSINRKASSLLAMVLVGVALAVSRYRKYRRQGTMRAWSRDPLSAGQLRNECASVISIRARAAKLIVKCGRDRKSRPVSSPSRPSRDTCNIIETRPVTSGDLRYLAGRGEETARFFLSCICGISGNSGL